MYIKGDLPLGAVELRITRQSPKPRGNDAMKTARMLALSAVAFAASISASWAGPCSGEIDAMVARINAALEARAGAGSTAKEQAVAAGRHVQPTPRSLATAEEKLGEMSPETIELVKQAMARAIAADSAGDNAACKQALAEVQRAIGP
jgi:hypothetical protein